MQQPIKKYVPKNIFLLHGKDTLTADISLSKINEY